MYYPAVFIWDKDCYQMYVPDIDGATAISSGDNIEGAIKIMEEMLSEVLSGYNELPAASNILDIQKNITDKDSFVTLIRGVKTKGKNIKVLISMPDYALNLIDDEAKRQGVTRSAYIVNKVLS